MVAAIDNPIPDQSETLERYTIRAHKAMLDSVPDPMERNRIVWDTWRQHRGLTAAEQRADKLFSPEKYRFTPNVCVFDEHQTVRSDGSPKQYGVRDLVKICRDNNKRISDRDAFSALSKDHTSDDPKADEPELLGFGGPFRIGMVGNENPVWAIFGDEFHDVQKLGVIDQRPRRSVELLTFRHSGEQIFDPIATLGTKAPRLSLPCKYDSRRFAEIERYSVGAAQLPAGGGTFTKELNCSNGGNGMQTGNELVSQIVEAVMATPEMQHVRSLMGQVKKPEPPAMPPPAHAAPAAPPVAPPAVPAKHGMPGCGSEDEFSDLLVDEKDSAAANGVIVERFNALQKSHNTLVQQMQGLLTENAKLGKDRSDANRRSKITELASRYPGFVNPEEEFATCLYSAGSSKSDAEFDKHVETVERYALRASALDYHRMPAGELPGSPEIDRKAAELAVEIHTQRVNAGKDSDWDSALAEARKQLSGK